MSDLIVIGYPDEATAEDVWRELIRPRSRTTRSSSS
jgi:hypothetical protein